MNPIGILTLLQPTSGILAARGDEASPAPASKPGRVANEADTYPPASKQAALLRVTYGRAGT